MDKRVFLAVTLCAGIFLLWENVYYKPYLEKRQTWLQQHPTQARIEGENTETGLHGAPALGSSAPGLTAAKTKGKGAAAAPVAKVILLGDKAYGIAISTIGGTVADVDLSEYRGQKTDKVRRLIGGPGQLDLGFTSPELEYVSNVNYTVEKQDGTHLILTYDDANVAVKRTYILSRDLYSLDNNSVVTFKKQVPAYAYIGLKTIKTLPKSELENERRQIFLNKAGGQKTFQVADIDELKEDVAEGHWFGFSSRYFLNAISDRSGDGHPKFQAKPLGSDAVAAGFYYPVSGSSANVPVRLYYGPKDIDVLREAGGHLDSAVDFGWFTIFAYPMLTALKWFYKYLHNFGLAIILLTVLVKAATYPLTLKSMRSMKQMQRIQPQLQRLRERHKDDKEKLNRETLQLMRANGYNPMSGCLPMFIQMPIFIALYNVLYGAIDLYGQPFFGWIHDLSAKDPLYVMPILLAVMMFVQQRMTPNTATDPAQQKMMMLMPVVFGFMMLWLPSGLTLYMLVNSLTSVVQQVFINRSMNTGAAVVV